ncbi:TetR/AcrR family transcriptional regulator [Paenibacillus sp. R14(2021)]|uniref:TetR/AcrR family transcriptional regulator n=1 Tax=Paenibacillus sp. R14(2021) TaxID=2859228 RepID=UPI001C614B99|nr:TetR/AcrR family transcriptional regulator [Paenibacillus sp. R14(2021)]
MNGFEKRASSIKAKIMNTTLELLRTTELKRIRVADIARLANVSQVTIYNYFGSKEALVRETFQTYFDGAIADFEAYLAEGHPLKEKIEHIVFLKKASFRDFPPGLIKELMAGDPEIALYIERQYREKSLPMTARIIEEGKESGEIASSVSTPNVLAFIQLFMNQYDRILDMAQNSGDRDGFLEGMLELFFYGLSGKR